MKLRIFRHRTTLVAVALALAAAVTSGQSVKQSPLAAARAWALAGGTVYVDPSEAPIPDGVVLIQNGAIAAVGGRASVPLPRGTEVLDCSGLTVVPGFWNSHVHFIERKWADASTIPGPEVARQLRDMLTRYGFTSVFDTGSKWENTRQLRERIESGEIPGPRIRSTGEILFPKGGSPPAQILDVVGTMRIEFPEVADAAQGRAAAKKILDAGTDGVKLYAATWAPPIVSLPEGAIAAAAQEAHLRGKLAFAHPSNREGLLSAVRGGVDVLVHTAPSAGDWDEEVLAPMRKAGVALIPTLKLWKHELRHDRASARDRVVGAGVGQLRSWVAAGGVILFGTDVGYMDDYDPSDEYVLMAEAGMGLRQILASLTTAPAERFSESGRRGRIAAGLAADLVVLGRDPARDIRALADVRYTIRDGRVIYEADAAGPSRPAVSR
jgi:imidazolonepropionase-like amidohydrolase